MERENFKGQQSPGEYAFHFENDRWFLQGYGVGPGAFAVAVGAGKYPTHSANAALYAEAHNVANRTGLWPIDMEQRIQRLEAALEEQRRPGGCFCDSGFSNGFNGEHPSHTEECERLTTLIGK